MLILGRSYDLNSATTRGLLSRRMGMDERLIAARWLLGLRHPRVLLRGCFAVGATDWERISTGLITVPACQVVNPNPKPVKSKRVPISIIHNGQRLVLSEVAEMSGVSISTVRNRYKDLGGRTLRRTDNQT